MVTPLVFATALGLTLTTDVSKASAQPKPPREETIPTADGMKLRGLFHRSPKGDSTSPVVLFLYPPGLDHTMTKPGDWDGLANTLNAEGFHVFRFDWRGHGKSTDISDPVGDNMSPFSGFWVNRYTGPYNQKCVPNWNRKPVKNDLLVKEIKPWYFPVYVEDLAAVRVYLDQLNDQGDLNSSSIYIIGAEDTAALGFLWMAAEWNRPGIHPILGMGQQYKVVPTPGIVNDPEGGRDVAGAIWLSATRPANVPSISGQTIQKWVRDNLKLRDNIPMVFLYGEKDPNGKSNALFYFDEVLVAKGNKTGGVNPLTQTFERPITGPNTNLKGSALLGKNSELKTEDTIVAYLKARQKERVAITVKRRSYVAPYYINLPSFGVNP
jgi:hypothetical protein